MMCSLIVTLVIVLAHGDRAARCGGRDGGDDRGRRRIAAGVICGASFPLCVAAALIFLFAAINLFAWRNIFVVIAFALLVLRGLLAVPGSSSQQSPSGRRCRCFRRLSRNNDATPDCALRSRQR
jgi:hypothetical protein